MQTTVHLMRVSAHTLTLKDADASWDGRWTNDPFGADPGLGLAEGVLSLVSFARAAGEVPVVVEVRDAAPDEDDLDDYEGVVEGSVRIASGALEFDVWDGERPRVGLPGEVESWRARVYYADGSTGRYDYAEGAEHARIALFPGDASGVRTLRPRVVADDPVREYRGGRSVDELRVWLAGASPSHQCLAAVALMRLGKDDVVWEAASTSPLVRRIYASTAWMVGDRADEALRALAQDPDPWLRARAVRSMGLSGSEACRALVERLAEDPHEEVQYAVEDARMDLDS